MCWPTLYHLSIKKCTHDITDYLPGIIIIIHYTILNTIRQPRETTKIIIDSEHVLNWVQNDTIII